MGGAGRVAPAHGDQDLQDFQTTLKNRALLSGFGVHSGKPVSLQFLPADPDTGVVFHHLDADGQGVDIRALVSEIGGTDLCTVIGDPAGRVSVTASLAEAVEDADAVMALRLQVERMEGSNLPSPADFTRRYRLTRKRLAGAKPDLLVLHPGPMNRGVEIASHVADSPRSVIRAQVENGVAVRMAVLCWCRGLDPVEAAS